MRWSELVEKEWIDIENGEKMGRSVNADLVIDAKTGKIECILFPASFAWFRKGKAEKRVLWQMIQKVGSDMVMVRGVEG